MKQTNNAIKFLMAQYRAIFKNANIAMVAAMAAAALAAGQAQAAPLENAGLDKIQSGATVTITGTGSDDGQTENKWGSLTLANGAKLGENVTGVIFSVKGGDVANNTLKGTVNLTGATLNVAADANTKGLTIGEDAAAATVTFDSVNLTKGKIAFTDATDPEATKHSLTAGNITVGDDGATSGDAVLSVGSGATVNGTTQLSIKKGANITVAAKGNLTGGKIVMDDGALTLDGTVSSDEINLNSGTVTLNAATAVLGSETSVITINGGKLTDATAGNSNVKAKTLDLVDGSIAVTQGFKITAGEGGFNVKGGTVDVTDGKTLTVEGKATVSSGTVTVSGNAASDAGLLKVTKGLSLNGKGKIALAEATNGGKLEVVGDTNVETGASLSLGSGSKAKFTGNVTFASDTLTSADGATIELAAGDNASSTLTFDVSDFDNVFAGKVVVSGGQTKSNVAINVLGDTDVDLTKILETAGTFKAAKVGTDNLQGAKLTVSAKKATFENGVKLDQAANFVFDDLSAGKTNAFAINKGSLTIKNKLDIAGQTTTLTVSGASGTPATLTLDRDGASGTGVVTAGTIKVSGAAAEGAILNVKNGAWNVNALEVAQGKVNLDKATLNLAGKLTTVANKGTISSDASEINAFGAGAIALGASTIALNNNSTLVLKASDVFEKADNTLNIKAGFAESAVSATSNSKIKLLNEQAGTTKVELTAKQYEALISGTKFNGLFENVDVSGLETGPKLDLSEVKPGLAGKYDNTVVNVGANEISGGSYDIGSATVNGDSLTLGSGGSLTLVNAGKNSNNFVSGKDSADKPIAAGVVLGDDNGNGLTLEGAGNIGAITGKTADAAKNGSVTFGEKNNYGTVNVKGSIGADGSEIGKVIVNDSTVKVDEHAYVENIDVNGGHVNLGAKDLVLGAGDDTLASTIDGKVTANELRFKQSSTGTVAIAGGADVDLKKLTGATDVKIQIGKDGTSVKDSSTASVYADTLELGSGSIFVDPVDGLPYSLLAVNSLKQTGTVTNDKVAGELNGTVNVGNNAVFGVGFKNKQEVIDAVAAYTKPTGSLNADHFNSALVLNKQVTLTNNDGLYVGKNATAASAQANKVTFESGAGLVITDNVFADVNGKKSGAAITVDSGATVNVSGAKLVFVGDFTGADKGLQIFSGVASITGAMTSQSANGYLSGTTTNTGTINLEFDREKAVAANAFGAASAPVRNLLLDKLDGKIAKSDAAGYDLISLVATSTKDGVIADAAAHAATYAGAQQAAVLSVTTMADAMFGRVGAVGVEAASIAATGSQANGGVWVSPMYKSMDSDGFNAQGASYGSDVDLSGVAFGTDTVNGNMRFGAVFNIGSGDAEGKGNGNGLKDEFDYYGFGIYSAMGFGNFALVGDASMTVVSHDVEGLGLRGKADTTAVTIGLTGQYTVSTPMVDVTPHLGARFIRLNTDSYDLVGADGAIATTDFDVQNVFSVPLGVTLSKAFVAGGWSLAPSADLTVTFNTGDTEAKSTTTFTGVKAINLNTEVLDEVQYGVTLGLGAQYGAFGTSFGINYTGSENTDSFGVNAQCRYMF